MKLQPKTLHDAILPLSILNWITGLSLFEYPLGKSRLALSFVYVFLTTSVYCYAYFHDPNRHIHDRNGLRRTIFQILKYANFFISTFCIVIGWYYHKAYKIVIKRMELLDEALESLGVENTYQKIFINLMLKIVIWLVMIGTVITFDLYFLTQLLDLVKCLHMCYLIHYPIQLNSVVDFSFTAIVNQVGLKFGSINFLLKRILSNDPESKTVKKFYNEKHRRINVLVISTESRHILNNVKRQRELIIILRHLHMELTEISFQVNKIYQTQIMMVLVAFLASMIGFLYVLFTKILFVNKILSINSRGIFSMVGWCALYVYRLLNVNSTCARVCSESHRTRNILYEMKNTIQNAELKEEIEQFSLQLTQRPLVFNICGFTTLDYPFVQKFIQTLTTYLVLLIQFSPEIRR